MNEHLDLILKSNQLIIRDRNWNNGDYESQSKVIDEQITDLLNPKVEPTLQERTFEPLSEGKK